MMKLLTDTTVPAGWMRCDGRELPIADYSGLVPGAQLRYRASGYLALAFAVPSPHGPAELPRWAALPGNGRPAMTNAFFCF